MSIATSGRRLGDMNPELPLSVMFGDSLTGRFLCKYSSSNNFPKFTALPDKGQTSSLLQRFDAQENGKL